MVRDRVTVPRRLKVELVDSPVRDELRYPACALPLPVDYLAIDTGDYKEDVLGFTRIVQVMLPLALFKVDLVSIVLGGLGLDVQLPPVSTAKFLSPLVAR